MDMADREGIEGRVDDAERWITLLVDRVQDLERRMAEVVDELGRRGFLRPETGR
jgi:hypothetical protein